MDEGNRIVKIWRDGWEEGGGKERMGDIWNTINNKNILKKKGDK